MLRRCAFSILLIGAMLSNIALGQSTRSLSGSLSLDVSPSEQDRVIEITVNNHSFVVIPPSFTILRPITSKQSALVTLRSGESSVDYMVNDIIDDPTNGDPADYTVALRCVGCASEIPQQYYSPGGNKFGFANSTYIDPNDLPATLNLTAITRASINGEIALGQASERELVFSIVVTSAQNPQRVFASKSSIRLPAGASKTDYRITGLNRAIDGDEYRVELQCSNCFGSSRRVQVFARTLAPDENHRGIDFSVTDVPPIIIVPTLDLLLH